MINRLLATCTVSDVERAEQWYTTVFDREPDARPMTGLLEWHLGDSFGVQVWGDPDRAGGSGIVVGETDLDAAAARLAAAGIEHGGVQPGGGARILPFFDPDGNQVVFLGD